MRGGIVVADEGDGGEQEQRSLTDEKKKLDEEVARNMVEGFGGVITQLTADQAKYIHVKVEGPYKLDEYKY